MSGLLKVVAGPDQGRTFRLTEGQNFLIGRGPNTDTRLHDPEVSRIHCVAQVRDGKVLLTDSGSRTGTRVNGTPITEHTLLPGDLIEIGTTQLAYTAEDSGPRYSTVNVDEITPPGPPPGA